MYSINLAFHFFRNTFPFPRHLIALTSASRNMGIIEHRGIKTALFAISFASPGTRTKTWLYACITSFYDFNTPPVNIHHADCLYVIGANARYAAVQCSNLWFSASSGLLTCPHLCLAQFRPGRSYKTSGRP